MMSLGKARSSSAISVVCIYIPKERKSKEYLFLFVLFCFVLFCFVLFYLYFVYVFDIRKDIRGTVGGLKAYYRSEDFGATWVRIDNSANLITKGIRKHLFTINSEYISIYIYIYMFLFLVNIFHSIAHPSSLTFSHSIVGTIMAADRTKFGRVFVGSSGRGVYLGDDVTV